MGKDFSVITPEELQQRISGGREGIGVTSSVIINEKLHPPPNQHSAPVKQASRLTG